MPFTAILNTAKVEVLQALSGNPVVNVFHIEHDAGAGAALLQSKANTIAKAWDTNFRPVQSNDLVYGGFRVTDLNSVDAPQVLAAPLHGNGNSTQQAMPGNVCALFDLRTDLRGKRYTGRLYLGGIDTLATDPGLPSSLSNSAISGYLGALVQFRTDLAAGVGTGGTSTLMVVASRLNGTSRLVTNISIHQRIASQKGRLR